MRRRHTRGGGTKVPPASCESPPLPSGRAARARVSDAFPLPPVCHCDRQGIGCHLRTVRVAFTAPVGAPAPGRSVAFTETANASLTSPAPPPPGSGEKTQLPRRYRKSNFSTACGQICLRSQHPLTSPGGGDSQEGAKRPLLCARRAQRHFLPVMNWHIRRAESWPRPASLAAARQFTFSRPTGWIV